MKLYGTMHIDDDGQLEIGACKASDLVKEYGTPLYVMDEEHVRQNCKKFKNSFIKEGLSTEVIYASKAFLTLAMCSLVQQEGLSLDVVSGGELYTAITAGFPSERLYFHGNNKTNDELEMALQSGVGRIIVDNSYEIERLEKLCIRLNKETNILLRVNPGIEAHTHQYIQTAKHDSKFGESIYDEKLCSIINICRDSLHLTLKGFHCHIGSQIFEEKSFYSAAKLMVDFLVKMKHECDFITEELNLGGGFGVYYADGDDPINIERCLEQVLDIIEREVQVVNIPKPKVMIEPGRAIVANAGCTLYTIGGIKDTYGGKRYVFVDGGMTDNPRTALYDAKYEAAIVSKMNEKALDRVTVAGKCCESGDVIIKDILLPAVEYGDILCVSNTGAYNYTMASNYNRIPRPPVVFVKDGQGKIVVRRESYKDLIGNDLIY